MFEFDRESRDLRGKSAGEIASLLAASIKENDVARHRAKVMEADSFKVIAELQSLHDRIDRYLAILSPHVPDDSHINVLISGPTPQVLTLSKSADGEIDGYDVQDAVLSVDLGESSRKPRIWPEELLPACEIHGFTNGTAG